MRPSVKLTHGSSRPVHLPSSVLVYLAFHAIMLCNTPLMLKSSFFHRPNVEKVWSEGHSSWRFHYSTSNLLKTHFPHYISLGNRTCCVLIETDSSSLVSMTRIDPFITFVFSPLLFDRIVSYSYFTQPFV